jgi:hypothetical protein
MTDSKDTLPASKNQRFNKNEKLAYEKGYRCVGGNVVSPKNNILKTRLDT